MKRALPALLCVAALSAATLCGACQTSDPTTDNTNIPTTPVNPVVQNLTGTVAVKGSDTQSFTVALSGGLLAITITSVTPSTAMSLGVGNWDGTTCSLLQSPSTINAAASPQLFGTVSAGVYCIVVSDLGTQTTPVIYTATITHY